MKLRPKLGHSYEIKKYKAEFILKNRINKSNNFKLTQMAPVGKGKV